MCEPLVLPRALQKYLEQVAHLTTAEAEWIPQYLMVVRVRGEKENSTSQISLECLPLGCLKKLLPRDPLAGMRRQVFPGILVKVVPTLLLVQRNAVETVCQVPVNVAVHGAAVIKTAVARAVVRLARDVVIVHSLSRGERGGLWRRHSFPTDGLGVGSLVVVQI